MERLGSREHAGSVATRLGRGMAELATDIRGVVDGGMPPNVPETIEADLSALALEGTNVTDKAKMAVAYARHLAGRAISTLRLVRAYRAGQRRLLRRMLEDVLKRGHVPGDEAAATLAVADRVSEFVDLVVDQLLTDYAETRKEWLDPFAILAARVRSIIGEPHVDDKTAQARLGAYRLRQHHLGAELWVDYPRSGADAVARMQSVLDELARAARCEGPPLFVPFDETTACVWLPLGDRDAVDLGELGRVLESCEGVYLAVGEPAEGLAGFRRTHQQAVSAEMVARVNVPPLNSLTPYGEIAPIAAMATNLDAARSWVAEVLGELSIDDARHATFRETARIFLATGGSYMATAQQLCLHRNTAQYRIRAAEDMRGKAFRSGRLDVELALLACRWFGRAVLTEPAAAKRIS